VVVKAYLSAAEADCDDSQIMAIWEEFSLVWWRGSHFVQEYAALAVSFAVLFLELKVGDFVQKSSAKNNSGEYKGTSTRLPKYVATYLWRVNFDKAVSRRQSFNHLGCCATRLTAKYWR
jgi:hypothetical protein